MSIAKKGFIEKIEIYNEDDPSIYVVYKYNSLYCYNIFHFPIKGEKIILGEQSFTNCDKWYLFYNEYSSYNVEIIDYKTQVINNIDIKELISVKENCIEIDNNRSIVLNNNSHPIGNSINCGMKDEYVVGFKDKYPISELPFVESIIFKLSRYPDIYK